MPEIALRAFNQTLPTASRPAGAGAVAADATPAKPSGAGFAFAVRLLEFAASWWFPWVAALGTGVNMFTLVFTAATVVLFLAAVLALRLCTTAAFRSINSPLRDLERSDPHPLVSGAGPATHAP